MKIANKLIFGFIALAISGGAVGYLSINIIQRELKKAIGESSILLAEETIDKIDRYLFYKIDEIQAYTRDVILRESVLLSNLKFEKINDINAQITERDHEWTSTPENTTTHFMQELLKTELSRKLREKVEYYEKKYGHKVFGEIFVTNKFGANIAQTGKTSDYYQADETWWQEAKEKGLHVGDIGYDESAQMYSIDIGVRIDDENKNFAGVIKAVLNLNEGIEIIKEFEAKESGKQKAGNTVDKYGKRGNMDLILLTKDYKVIFSTEDFKILEDMSNPLRLHFKRMEETEQAEYCIVKSDRPGEGKVLFAHAYSKGYKDYRGLDWILVVGCETEEIFAPVASLKRTLMIAFLGVMIFAILIGLFIFRSISVPITKLKNAAVEIGRGELSKRVDIISNDEIGLLSRSFNKMAGDLSVSMKKQKELTEAAEAAAGAEKQKSEELRAANQQLKASEQQLKAANQQSKANEQQLRAANQQIGAKEQALRESQEVLKSKMADLERFNKIMVGRELEMVKLKGEVNSLLEQLKQPEKYKIS